jgi:transcription antitermination factor NusG
MTTPPASWFALRVKPRHERSSAAHLAGRGLEQFAPLYRTRRRWSDRIQAVDLPLFPGYVFCRFTRQQKRDVVSAPGVRSVVSFGGEPAPIGDGEIDAVRAIAASGLPYGPWPFLRQGARVRIAAGCMKGLEGTLVRSCDEVRVVVNVELLQRSVAVQIDRALLGA